ncbi:MAG: molybdopterin molybdotransferase MoeA [Candidatus Bathyarchaeota archaeon]|nr:molybdopterin molybdotransferase MoeA [Candidatus Bathyarchaeota archaeon]
MDRPDIRRLPKRADPRQAVELLLSAVNQTALQTQTVPLQEAVGRVLAADAVSPLNIPDYDKTFIDGYAVDPKQTQGATPANPAVFRIVGKLFPPDHPTTAQLASGETMYVACGAPIPKGAACTVKVEETRLNGDRVEVVRELKPGEGIIPLGDDVKKGELVLRRGQVLRPQDVGLLASLHLTRVEVFKRPVVTVISGGDELLKQCEREPKHIANNYALVIAGLAYELGADAKQGGIMSDNLDKVTQTIKTALQQSDIVLTIGGSSVGVKDFVPDAINAIGEPGVLAQGIKLRPGALSGFGIVDGKPIIMLPGHIGSCIAGFYLFAAPLLSFYTGLQGTGMQPALTATLTETIQTGPQNRFQFVKLTHTPNGKLTATPTKTGSSALTTIVNSNGYTLIPPHTTTQKNTTITIHLFNKLELTQTPP